MLPNTALEATADPRLGWEALVLLRRSSAEAQLLSVMLQRQGIHHVHAIDLDEVLVVVYRFLRQIGGRSYFGEVRRLVKIT